MFVCISPVLYNAEETFCSLNFASRLDLFMLFKNRVWSDCLYIYFRVRQVELGKASKQVGGGAAGGPGRAAASGAKPPARRPSPGAAR